MNRTVRTRESFTDPRTMSATVRRNAMASSAFEGASAKALRISSGKRHDSKASSKKSSSGS